MDQQPVYLMLHGESPGKWNINVVQMLCLVYVEQSGGPRFVSLARPTASRLSERLSLVGVQAP